MPGKRELLSAAASLRDADRIIYGESRALTAAGFQRTELGWRYGRAMLTSTSLQLPPDATVDEWDDIGRALGNIQGAIQWWIADLVIAGNDVYGVKYDRAMDVTGLSYKTLRNYVTVARRFEMSLRRDNLSFGHHALVAALEPLQQQQWLDLAEDKKWSVATLRDQLHPKKVVASRRLKVIRQRLKRVLHAAAAGGAIAAEDINELEQWIRELRGRASG